MEKVYKTMRNSGAACIAVGIVIATVGLTTGIIAIVSGALLLKRKSEITFYPTVGEIINFTEVRNSETIR